MEVGMGCFGWRGDGINISYGSKIWYQIPLIKVEVFFSNLALGIFGETFRKAIGDAKSYYFL